MVATRTETIEIDNLPTDIQNNTDHSLTQPTPSGSTAIFAAETDQKPLHTSMTIQEMEKSAFVEAFKIADGNVEQVAQSLGISRATCYRKIKKYKN